MPVLQTCRDLVNQDANFQMPILVLDHKTAWIHCTTASHDLFPFVCLKHYKQYFVHVKFLSAYKMWKVLQIIFGLTRHMCLSVPSQGLFQALYVVVFLVFNDLRWQVLVRIWWYWWYCWPSLLKRFTFCIPWHLFHKMMTQQNVHSIFT